ncbi:MAG TPA: sugar ABC transporter ATP-binding protein [Solirubrobacteraceae bacterium]|jgi:ABC-type sugar transport system ATPase subunit
MSTRSHPQDGPPTPFVEVEGLTKSYGAIQALRDVSLSIPAGEVHGVCGHNGAGKSTLVKCLVGLTRPDSGVIRVDGQAVHLHGPQDAQSHGIAIVDQELSLVPALSVEDNIFLGGIDVPMRHHRSALRRRARDLLDSLGLSHVPLNAPVERLLIGERQLVEVARLLARDARLLILDEPTATLSTTEIERVFAAVRELVAQGRSVIFVSHRLGEVFEICHRVTVFRDGERVATHAIGELDRPALVKLMLGEMEGAPSVTPIEDHHSARTVAMRIGHLNVPGRVRDFSLTVHRGEIVGLAGQVGSGASEVLRALGGLIPGATGACEVAGRPARLRRPMAAVEAGVLYVPSDRQGEGLFLHKPVEQNLTVIRLRWISRFGLLLGRRSRALATELAARVDVARDRLGAPAAELSGGNQQKVLLGRVLARSGTAVLALDEPTRGVDVGGRGDIHRLIRDETRTGIAVIFSSTELDEVLDLADTVVTMFEGSIVSIVPRAQANSASVLEDMTTRRAPAETVPA